MKIRLLVACREQRCAEAHCAALSRVAGDHIAAVGTALHEVTRISAQLRPDVIALEYVATEEDRLWHILHRLPVVSARSRVMMLCDRCTDRLVASFIAHGACGSVAIASDASLWAKAVTTVHRGESWFARATVLQALRRQLMVHPDERTTDPEEERLLTAREREILSLIRAGMSNKEIARALRISDQTVKTHLHHVYVKLNRSGRYKAVAAASMLVTLGATSAQWHPPAS